ncbi:MAG: sensor histidine kinase [Polyangiales bacterium]
MKDPFAIFAALGTLVLERDRSGAFRKLGSAPAWCCELWSDCATGELAIQTAHPFLEAFIADAEEAWRGAAPVASEIWTELDEEGREVHLQATALRVSGSDLLLVERSDALHDAEQQLLQRARELRLTHDALSREVEQKDVLVHCIIHDLQGPLNTILGTLSLFEERELPTQLSSLAATAQRAAQRERDLIRDILQVFAAEHEVAMPVAATPLTAADLLDVLTEAIALIEPSARAKGIRVERPEADGTLQVVGDRSRLLRVASNLLENALRHAREHVAVTLSSEEASARLTVEDDGPGVATDVVEHLFEKFARTSGSRGGTGLGLYFCRITVERWGGAIGHEPREGGGARFWVRLPRAPVMSGGRDGKALGGG